MDGADQTYLNEIRNELGFTATWPPNASVRLGDVGRFNDGCFMREFTLADRNMQFDETCSRNTVSFRFASREGASVSITGRGSQTMGTVPVLPNAKAGLVVRFSRKSAVYFAADCCVVHEIRDVAQLGEKILKMYRQVDSEGNRGWSTDLHIVTELVTAEGVTILISGHSSAFVEMSLEASGPAGLATASTGASILNGQNMSTVIVAEKSLTPLFRVRSVRKRLFRQPSFRGNAGSSSPECSFDDPIEWALPDYPKPQL